MKMVPSIYYIILVIVDMLSFVQENYNLLIYLYPSFVFAAVCSPECDNGGVCLRNGTCSCQTGWEGQHCEQGFPLASDSQYDYACVGTTE